MAPSAPGRSPPRSSGKSRRSSGLSGKTTPHFKFALKRPILALEVPMFIQTEATPNPATLKFIPGQPVIPGGTREYRTIEDAEDSALAQRLFGLPGVSGVC